MSKLIVVCGLSGVGKTTLVNRLSKELKILALQKDFFKESIYDSMSFSTLKDSKKLGKSSIDLVFQLAEQAIKNEVDVIIEGMFSFQEDVDLLEKWKEKYNIGIYTIICSIDEKSRKERYLNRANNDRHVSHHDLERIENQKTEKDCAMFMKDFDYDRMPGKKIKVVTDKPIHKLVEKIKRELR
jgi:predicted kinase